MTLGRVIGHVVSTQKAEGLTGGKLLIVRMLGVNTDNSEIVEAPDVCVAVDTVQAGVGEMVIMTCGTNATKYVKGYEKFPTDLTIVGIVDYAELSGH